MLEDRKVISSNFLSSSILSLVPDIFNFFVPITFSLTPAFNPTPQTSYLYLPRISYLIPRTWFLPHCSSLPHYLRSSFQYEKLHQYKPHNKTSNVCCISHTSGSFCSTQSTQAIDDLEHKPKSDR